MYNTMVYNITMTNRKTQRKVTYEQSLALQRGQAVARHNAQARRLAREEAERQAAQPTPPPRKTEADYEAEREAEFQANLAWLKRQTDAAD